MDDSLPGSEFGIRYGRKCIKCLQKLSKKHGILPPSYVRHDIAPEGSHAVCGGTYSVRLHLIYVRYIHLT